MIGEMTNDAEFWKIHRVGRFWGPWFYKHVEKYFKTGEGVEYIPLRDYYHRHTRSLFWEMEDIIPFGHNLLFRILLGWLVPPKVAFLKLTTTQELHELHEKKHVIEDYLVPMSQLPKTLGEFTSLVSTNLLRNARGVDRLLPSLVVPLQDLQDPSQRIGKPS